VNSDDTAAIGADSSFNSSAIDMLNTTAKALAGAAMDGVSNRRMEWTGMGVEWLRSLLGKREWSIDCMEIKIRL
jgi:hypothetical protein